MNITTIGAGGEERRSHLIRDNLESLYTLGPGMDKPATNAEKIKRMKQLLKVAMQFSLTDRQVDEPKDALSFLAQESGIDFDYWYKNCDSVRYLEKCFITLFKVFKK